MTHIIARLFDSLDHARQAAGELKRELERAGVPQDAIALVSDGDGIVAMLTGCGVSRDEAEVHAEGVRRGGTLVSVKVEESMADAARAAIDSQPFVDIGVRRESYRLSGWTHEDEAPPSALEIAHDRAR